MLAMLVMIPQCLNDDFYLDKPTPIFHISTEVLRPYYYGWVVNKRSKWRNAVNAHILRFQQVRLNPTSLKSLSVRKLLTFGYLSPLGTFGYLWLPFLTFPYLSLVTFLYLSLLTFPYLWLPFLAFPCLSLPFLALPFLTLPFLSLFCICLTNRLTN